MSDTNQNESGLPLSNNESRKSKDLLPRYYRTDNNQKFLSVTVDQLIQPGAIKKLSGYIGRQNAKSVTGTDIFLEASDTDRQNYQLEPAAIIQDFFGNVTFYKDYIDHINHVSLFGGDVKNHERLNQQEFYSWDPHIDWDKFVNFQQYYWLPYGPDPIPVAGQQLAIISTYTVVAVDEDDNYAYVFTPDGLSKNPTIKLYRGQTYKFEINTPNNPFSIKTSRIAGTLNRYTVGVSEAAVENGTITFTVQDDTPDILFYVSEADANTGGIFQILDITENTALNVDTDILGKKTYTMSNGIALSNGMKLRFIGQVTPELYANSNWYVEGVGSAIKLIAENNLEIVSPDDAGNNLPFDDEAFDAEAFSTAVGVPLEKDYLVINRASPDRNPWSRTNRWFHKDIIYTTASALGKTVEIDELQRATRPIIEFKAGIKLLNFGHEAKINVDLIDTFTTDVFSTIEGSLGVKIDEIDVIDGMRILFTADPDILVKDKIFKVNFIDVTIPGKIVDFSAALDPSVPDSSSSGISPTMDIITCLTDHGFVNGQAVTYLNNGNVSIAGLTHRNVYYVKVIDSRQIKLFSNPKLSLQVNIMGVASGTHSLEVFSGMRTQINLVEDTDSVPLLNETVLVKRGAKNQGKMFWYTGDSWKEAQAKTGANQAPLFDVFDSQGNSYGDLAVYDGSSFARDGTKIFSYKQGIGKVDSELGFPLSYQNINNVGDIVFTFDLLNDTFTYKDAATILTKRTDIGFVKIISTRENFKYQNGWLTSLVSNAQPVIRIYKNSGLINNFPIDVYDDKDSLDDLQVRVYVNSKRLYDSEFDIVDGPVRKHVALRKDAALIDVITLKCFSKQPKNNNGHYEIPVNLQNNPKNENITQFTLGEVVDHVDSIVDNITGFAGIYPGSSNIRDLGNITPYGTKFVQHSGPLNLSLYHLGSKLGNAFKAIEKSRLDYGVFKREFISIATNSGIDTDPRRHVDHILTQLTKDKTKLQPYYLSDMFAFTSATRLEYDVLDSRTKKYPLTVEFNLNALSNKSVLIYLNGNQLLHGRDYVFGDNNFFEILTEINEGDIIEAFQFDSTDGSFCPPTPTKLGLYPLFEPKKFLDTTYLEPTEVIQGHDGSIVVAFGDYRDDLLLELESRIFNNIKVRYDPKIFDIYDYIPGYSRDTAYSKQESDSILSQFFFQWASGLDRDFTDQSNDLWDRFNPFTFNFQGNYTPNGVEVPAFWRGIYSWMLDTDRPHTHPWECLGFSIMPAWWEAVYGPAPYTSNNLILWEDIRKGIIREPGVPIRINKKFAKSILAEGMELNEANELVEPASGLKPVDADGALLDPLNAGFVNGFIKETAAGYYVFGDGATVESAWRRSSYYPFAVIQTALLMQPNKVLGTCLDRSRIVRNINDQFVYSDTGLRLQLKDIAIPSTGSSSTRVMAAGIINYVVEYLYGNSIKGVEQYQSELKKLVNKLGSKLGGFTDKAKFRMMLDSKSPTASSGVFIPEENYQIALNTSSPIKRLSYSGIIITKYSDGYEVRGYDVDHPYFTYYQFIGLGRPINVGGISESYVRWEANQFYVAGKIVRANNQYYRVKSNHTSGDTFDPSLYAKLPQLPITGGRDAILRNQWNLNSEFTVAYGTKFNTIQDLVDFIQGYGVYLENQGFIFDNFNSNLKAVSNWETAVKEFLFWTTQNWNTGAVLSISPAANKLIVRSDFSVVDNIRDQFFGYKIYRVDGLKLSTDLINLYRENNEFAITSTNTAHGIYGAVLHLVQKEHVALLDNKTIFNDVIYDVAPGYRQEKIKVLGYISAKWSGGFNVPGFLFDQAKIQEWIQWQDYYLGDIVKYKEFYYSAEKFIPGTAEFEDENWIKLDSKAEPKLLPNWDYRAEQFTDYYDLESDNFDKNQQKIAQHLIGYQKRQYLENIIKDDISQYKFYQGMIIEKGTQNVLSKLFDVLSSINEESLVFNEEWAVRVGNYGATEIYDEVEFKLDESNFKLNPQPFELLPYISERPVDFVYRQAASDVYIKPSNYDSNPWKLKTKSAFLRSPGYVRYEDVALNIDSIDEILTKDITTFYEGDYIWCAFEGRSWNVYRFTKNSFAIEDLDYSDGTLKLTCNKIPNVVAGSIIGIHVSSTTPSTVNGFYKITSVVNRDIIIKTTLNNYQGPFDDSSEILTYKLPLCRVANADDINSLLTHSLKPNELVWADNNGTNLYTVYANNSVFETAQLANTYDNSIDNLHFGKKVTVSKNGKVAAVASDKSVMVYVKDRDRESEQYRWINRVRLETLSNNTITSSTIEQSQFGKEMCFSPDGAWLAVAAPYADNIKTAYRGEFVPSPGGFYSAGDIVKIKNTLWRAKRDYNDDGSTITNATQDWEQVFLINTDASRPGSALTNQGYVQLFYKTSTEDGIDYQTNNSYRFVSPDPTNNEKFGSKMTMAKDGDDYVLAVSSIGYNNDQGRVYTFRGFSVFMFDSAQIYNRGDVAFYDDALYGKGYTSGFYEYLLESDGKTAVGVFALEQWKLVSSEDYSEYFWKIDYDSSFVGMYDSNLSYNPGQIVFYNYEFYKCLASTVPGAFVFSKWELITGNLNVTGYFPHETNINGVNLTVPAANSEFVEPVLEGDNFGYDIAFTDDAATLVISAPVADQVTPENYKGLFDATQVYDKDDVVYYNGYYSYLLESDGSTPVGSFVPGDWELVPSTNATVPSSQRLVYTGKVFVYKNNNSRYNLAQTIGNPYDDSTEKLDRFGESVSITPDGNYLAVGGNLADVVTLDAGRVSIFKRTNDQFSLNDFQTLTSNNKEINERFGSKLSFMTNDTLAVFALNGDSSLKTYFDAGATTFDNETSNIVDYKTDTGRVDIYNRLNTYFIYGESLPVDISIAATDRYGSTIGISNNDVLVGTPYDNKNDVQEAGSVSAYSRKPNANSWLPYRVEVPRPDAQQIKKAYLYDRIKNKLVMYLDVVDPIQGKIPEPASNEIRYKTYYDPAIYSVGTSDLNVDAGISWTKTHVGELWWDLTRARFIENQGGDVVYRSTSWNRLYETASIDIYEWVETKLLPEAWDALSGTPEGDIQGISGKSRYGNTVYSVKKRYDTLTKKFYNTYYYWVKNPNIIPNNFGRKLSAEAVSKLIADPMSQGYSCLALTDSNTFSLVNVTNLIAADYHNLNIQYWTVDLGYTENNAHSQWKIISENENTTIPKNIETKWIDSLVGKDANGKSVPDVNLPVKLRYGIDFKFRQSMFANRIEALKQYFERVNSVLKNKLIVDSYDLSKLDLYEEPPTAKSGEWDFAIDTFNEFKFLKVSNLQQAIVEPTVSPDGYITGIKAIHAGKGYVNAPYIKISGQGRNAVVRSVGINSTDGSLQLDPNDPTKLNVEIINRGEGYLQNNTTATVRTHKILVRSDAESFNKWAIYERIFNITSNKWEWVRTKTQSYDVRQYWAYIDWYDTGYSEFTKFDFVVENTYELSLIEDDIGDIIKVNNVGSGGWMLLEKYDNIDTIDYTENYKVVGRGNGTIQFLGSLYDYKKYNVGYDGPLYDSVGYDNLADKELVIILSFVKEDLFVDDLRIEYLKLFFSSLRYVLHEQIFVDWVFKTSFVKAIHNVGELKEKVTYNSDNLSDFESYISEVKPYRTQIREFVSLYNRTEPAGMSTTDFDLLPVVNNKVKTDTLRVSIDEASGNIVNDVNSWTRISSETILQVGKQYLANTSSGAFAVYLPDNPVHNDVISITDGSNWAANNLTVISSNKTINGLTKNFIVDAADTTLYITYNEDIENWNITIGSNSSTLANYPWKYWLSNVGFSVQSIEILDGGSGYLADPKVTIVGGFGNGATARAVKVNGQIIRIDIISSGSGYLKAPIVEINGNLSEGGRPARAIAIIESEVVRSNKIAIKFDRVTKNYFVSELTSTETFVGTGSKIQFNLRFSPQITRKNIIDNQLLSTVTVNGKELLSGEYSLVSKKSISRGYTSYSGLLIFKEPPANNDQIEITYHKDFNHLTAADRINFYYNSTTGRLGKDLAQLMTGIDYGGVIVTGLDLSPQQGWDILPWSKDDWDKFDESFDDYAVISDGISITFTLPFTPNIGEEINVYVEGVRVDDPYFDLYDGSTVQPNGLINPPANTVLNTIIGDGSTLTFTLPSLITSSGDVIVFRRSTSDGSVNIDSYDTLLSGGDMAYSTATGINPDEIIVDGDKFVTPMTSHAPEEVVPGQLADAVAIKVYQLPSSGSSKISFKNYVCDGSTTAFVVNQLPSNPTAIFVKLNNVILERDVDFTFNWETSLLELIAASSAGDNLSIITFGVASQNLLDTNYFVADGSTFEYITNAPWTNNLGSVVLVNGEAPPAYELFRTNEGYVSPGLVGIRFVPQNTPDVNAVISYMITSDQNQSSSIIKSEVITPDGSSTIYTLENTIGNARPNETNVLTIVNGKILRPANVEYFTLDNDQLIYPLSVYKSYPYLIDPANYKVYLDGVELSQGAEYIIDVYNSSFGDVGAATIELNNQLYKDGSVLSVANFVNAEYLLLQSGNNFSIEFATVPAIGDKIEVISFYNHDVQEIIRTSESIELQGTFTPLSYSYETYQNLVDNSITLFRTVISHDYVWVIKNNSLLTPNIDYALELDRRTIVLTDPLVTTDILDVIRFNDRTVRGSYGYMQFKDMLNRDHYKRLSKNKTTELTKNLLPTDTEIHVKNAAVLGNANPSQNIPGVLEINGERVEYFVKTGNVLSQLRRGTLGTGIPALHRAGQYVIDIGVSETIPYKDEYIIDKSMSDSSTQNVDLSYIPSATTTGWSVNGGYKQCNEIEVFVGGYRLKKTPFSVFEESNGYPYSPEGDTAYPAQFSVNGVNQSVRLTDIPPENTKIVVIKKTGYVWNDLNTSFDQSDNIISKFIRANETVFPQYLADKYQYILETDDYYPVNTDDNDIVELD